MPVASGDGRYTLTAEGEPPALVIRASGAARPLAVIPIRIEGDRRSKAVAIVAIPARESFLVALADIAELWEISTSDHPPYRGWVHDHRDDGPPSQVPRFPVRRIPMAEPLGDLIVLPAGDHVAGYAPASRRVVAIDLYIGRIYAATPLGPSHRWEGRRLIQRAGKDFLVLPDAGAIALADWTFSRDAQ